MGTAATAYLFELTSGEYAALQGKFTLTDCSGKALSDLILTEYGSNLEGATDSKKTLGSSQANFTNATGKQETVDKGPATLYAALLYTYTDGTGPDATTYWMGNLASGFIEDAADATVGNLGLKIDGSVSGAATAWTTAAIPEPTSAMLLLLGMAGLALRRRRA